MGELNDLRLAEEIKAFTDRLAEAVLKGEAGRVRKTALDLSRVVQAAQLKPSTVCYIILDVALHLLTKLGMERIDPAGFRLYKKVIEKGVDSEAGEEFPTVIVTWSLRMLDSLKTSKRDPKGQLAVNVRHLIELRFRDRALLDDLSRQLGYSTSHLCRLVKAKMGTSPHEMISRRRIQEALSLIGRGCTCLKAIAYEVGFQSYDAFAYNFRKHAGVCPLSYVRAFARKRSGGRTGRPNVDGGHATLMQHRLSSRSNSEAPGPKA